MLNLTHSAILQAERFGSRSDAVTYLCTCCNKELTEDEAYIDRFGRSFCGEECYGQYYNIDRRYC